MIQHVNKFHFLLKLSFFPPQIKDLQHKTFFSMRFYDTVIKKTEELC